MSKKIKCPRHDDNVPSCIVRPTHLYCFAGCGEIPLSEVGLTPEDTEPELAPANIAEEFEYIDTLPCDVLRGFVFPNDSRGFYIPWPDRSFFKKRMFNPGRGPKYVGPRGHFPPPFWARKLQRKKPVFVVEGELNALSIAKAFPEYSVVSPGSATQFHLAVTRELLTKFAAHANILLVLDDDAAGKKAAIEAVAAVRRAKGSVWLALMPTDANELLVTHGAEKVKSEVLARLSQGL